MFFIEQSYDLINVSLTPPRAGLICRRSRTRSGGRHGRDGRASREPCWRQTRRCPNRDRRRLKPLRRRRPPRRNRRTRRLTLRARPIAVTRSIRAKRKTIVRALAAHPQKRFSMITRPLSMTNHGVLRGSGYMTERKRRRRRRRKRERKRERERERKR